MDRTYRIKKILNNNVVQAKYGCQEVIVVGLGIGFNAKVKDLINPDKIEKVFDLRKDDYYKTSQLAMDIPEDMFFDLYKIIDQSAHYLDLNLDSHAMVTMIDHLNFAIQRHISGQEIRNLMLFDLRILYPDEFRLGSVILKKVNSDMKHDLPEDEIGFLTMHIVNGINQDIKNQSSILTDMIFDSLNIIRDHYLTSLKLDDLATQRIMIHIKMLIQRVMSQEQVQFEEVVLNSVMVEFDNAYSCAQKIQAYIETRLNMSIMSQELVYMTIHLNRLEMMIA